LRALLCALKVLKEAGEIIELNKTYDPALIKN
jgi:hypothetical protein